MLAILILVFTEGEGFFAFVFDLPCRYGEEQRSD